MKNKKFYMLVFVFSALSFSINIQSQSSKKDQILAIRKYFQKVNSELNSYTKKTVLWSAGDAYWNNTNYTGYFNSEKTLVLLKFSHGEEGYWADYEYYFKDNTIIFIYIASGTPDNSEKQERIYFWNKKIIEALAKEKNSENNADINEIENKPYSEILSDIEKATKNQLEQVRSELINFNEALKNNKE